MDSGAGDALLGGGALTPLREDFLDPRSYHICYGGTLLLVRHPPCGLGVLEVLGHGVAAYAHLLGHRADAVALKKHLVPDDVYLVHPQHPSSSSCSGNIAQNATGSLGRGWLSFSALRRLRNRRWQDRVLGSADIRTRSRSSFQAAAIIPAVRSLFPA